MVIYEADISEKDDEGISNKKLYTVKHAVIPPSP